MKSVTQMKWLWLWLCTMLPAYGQSLSDSLHSNALPRHIHDSSQIVLSALIPMEKVIVSPDPHVLNERYDQFPNCPQTPYCKNIAHLSDADTPTCPSVCTQTRKLIGPQLNNGHMQSIDAVCPAGYVQVASYNVQDEVAYIAHPVPQGPIPIGKWNWYLANDYICEPSNSTRLVSICDWANKNIADVRSISPDEMNLGVNPKKPAVINGMAGTWLKKPNRNNESEFQSKECYAPPNCLFQTRCGNSVQRKFYFPWRHYECRHPSGIYATGKKAPVSIVCVHQYTNWQPVSNVKRA